MVGTDIDIGHTEILNLIILFYDNKHCGNLRIF